LNEVVTGNSDEDDYKDDAPTETATTDIIGAYDLQLEQ